MTTWPVSRLLRVLSVRDGQQPFHLLRWFSVTALLSVMAVSVAAGLLLSSFLTERMVRQDAEVTAAFIRSILNAEGVIPALRKVGTDGSGLLSDALLHLAYLPDVLRTNLYGTDRGVIWSSDPALIGRHFDQNDELEDALRAQLVVNSGVVERDSLPKSEHIDFDAGVHNFVEIYTPIVAGQAGEVVAVVEVYKVPRQLFDAIRDGKRLIWLAAAAAGLFLYLALYWIVRRAHLTIEAQRNQLIEAESLAVVGEMGSAVAHGLRNPLASIRSSAELAQEDLPAEEIRECASDIVTQVDRLDGWINQLLSYARPTLATLQRVDVNASVQQALPAYVRELERQGTRLELALAEQALHAQAEPGLLVQLIGSLLANASEALGRGGEIRVATRTANSGAAVVIEVSDTGPGMDADARAKAFKPFYTSKPRGLGLGLPLLRRVVQRFGGSVELDSAPGQGTTVRLLLRGAQKD